jgi:hypothetical protein
MAKGIDAEKVQNRNRIPLKFDLDVVTSNTENFTQSESSPHLNLFRKEQAIASASMKACLFEL